jgi:putative nucleotidyltransferase with HDIG domain
MGKSKFPGLGSSGAKTGSREALQSRSKYIGHSMQFLDWVNGLGIERTRLGGWAQHLDEAFQLRRLSLLFLFSVSLSMLLFYDFDFSYSARIGDRATHDVKSPVSLDVIDEVSTEEKRKLAENSVPLVYDYDRSLFSELYNRIYTSFRVMRKDVRNVSLSRDDFVRFDQVKDLFKIKPEFEKSLGHKVSDQAFEWLLVNRFSPRIENMVIETLDQWQQYKIADGVDKLTGGPRRDVLVREVARAGNGREALVPLRELKDVSRYELFPIEHLNLARGSKTTDQRLFEEFMHAVLMPNVTLNRQETETRKQKARDEVLPITIKITKNQVIIPEGSMVQPIHATILSEIEHQRSGRNRNFIALVASVMFVVMLLVFSSYLRRFTLNRVRASVKDAVIMGTVTLLVVIIMKFFVLLTTTFSTTFGTMIPESAFMFAAPAAAGTMLVGLLITAGEIVWIFSLFLAVVLGLMVDMKFSFMLVTVIGSLAAARGVFGCKTRNDLYVAGLRTGLVNGLMVMLVVTVQHFGDDTFMHQLVWAVPAGFLSGLLSSVVAMSFIPLLETIFNCTTDVKLLELSNLNHPLLKEMIVKAPGTYHHSLVVGSMVESAAEEIGANSLLAKVMSYYHDIGKTEHAQYFIENQKPGQNLHDHLSPHMSKTILIAHVKDGVELGVEHKLGKPIIDGIVQHHGTTLIAFFYNRALEKQDEEIDDAHEEEFRYPGPKPQFREAALIMLADSIEAASRSLDEPTPVRLQNITKNIIQRKFMDGQLDECNLTLKELSIIEASFNRVLMGIYHQRIDYPRRAGGGASESPQAEARSHGSHARASAGSHSGASVGGQSASVPTNVLPGPGVKK